MKKQPASILLFLIVFILKTTTLPAQNSKSNDENILNFLNLKFGMFIHYNMGTYHAEQWAKPFHNPTDFKPSALDCDQWAAQVQCQNLM